MSLAHLAQNMAAQGRNGDTMLMHVTPNEVQRLQRAAESQGKSLTINPQTGLPEANIFEDIGDAVKDVATSPLGSLVIGAGLASFGIPPAMAGLYTGLGTAALTGDLKQGLFAGMGAYGGAGLYGGLAGLGAAEAGAGLEQLGGPGLENSVQGSLSTEVAGAAPTQLSGPGMAEAAAEGVSTAGVDGVVGVPGTPTPVSPINAGQVGQTVQTTTQAPTFSQNFANAGAGVDRLTSPGGIDALRAQMASGTGINAPSMNQALGFGAAGMLGSGMFDQKNPAAGAKQHPGYIRPYNYDPYGQRYTAQTPVKADEWGSRSFNAADGGIVALAHGGAVRHFDKGGYTSYTPEQINNYFAQNPTVDMGAAIKEFNADPAAVLAARTSANAAEAATVPPVPTGVAAPAAAPAAVSATPAYNQFTNDQMATYFADPKNANVNVADAVKQFNADPNAVNQYVTGLTSGYKDPIAAKNGVAAQNGSGYLGVYQNLIREGMTPAEFAAAQQGLNKDWGTGDAYWNQGTVAHAYDVAGKILAFDPLTDKVTPSDKEWVAFMDSNELSVDDISRATGLNTAEVQRRYDAAKEKPVVHTGVTPTGSYGSDIATGTSASGKTVDLTTPGDITRNDDGTSTVAPNLPGGGNFTGIGDVTDRYTAGGGSTGYTPYAPKTAAEHSQFYDRQTGGSRAAFDYLMGSGEYPTVPSTPTGEIMKPYSEAVLGVQPDNTRFAQRFNPTTRKYEANPDYKPFNFNPDTGQTTRGMNQAELATFVADPKNLTVPSAATGWISRLVEQAAAGALDRPVWMEKNNISYEQLAASLGISVADAKKRYPVTGGQTFDATAYLAANPDVATALKDSKDLPGDAWKHYTTYGQKEGRAYTYGAAPTFNVNTGTLPDPYYGVAGGGDSGDGASAGPGDGAGNSAGDAGGPGADGGVGGDGSSGGGDGGSASASRGGYIDRNRVKHAAFGGIMALAGGGLGSFGGYASGGQANYNLGGYSDGGRLLRGPGDGVSDSIPASIGNKQPARLADGEFVVPARIVSELGNGSTEAGARKLYAMMDRVQKARGKTTGKGKVATNSRSDKYLPV